MIQLGGPVWPGARAAVPAAVVCAIALVPISMGWAPFLRYAWGFNLWQYLPVPFAWTLAGATLLLVSGRWRRLLARGFEAAGGLVQRHRSIPWIAVAATPLLLWLARERLFFGDSKIYIAMLNGTDVEFIFPEIGATFLLRQAFRLGEAVGLQSGVAGVQAVICVAGAAALVCFAGLGAALAGRTRGAWLATFLLAGGAIARTFAGHLEVYCFVLIFGAAYLWSGLACLRGRCGWLLPSLLLGAGLWTHLQFIFLVPAHLLLLQRGLPSAALPKLLARWAVAATVVAAPTLLFFVAMLVGGSAGDLQEAWTKLIEWSNLDSSSGRHEAWLRFWTDSPGPGTRYVILSGAHLKYLANAFFLLVPTVVPLLAVLALRAPRRFLESPEAAFLSAASLSMLLYAVIVRPVWGPYDWDLFSLTALCLAALAALRLREELDEPPLMELGAVLVTATLLLVTIPFFAMGVQPGRDAGPFSTDAARSSSGQTFNEAFEANIQPWL